MFFLHFRATSNLHLNKNVNDLCLVVSSHHVPQNAPNDRTRRARAARVACAPVLEAMEDRRVLRGLEVDDHQAATGPERSGSMVWF